MLIKMNEVLKKRRKGFTIIELMVVCFVLLILIALANGGIEKVEDFARSVVTSLDMRTISDGCIKYKGLSVHGKYPDNLGELITGLSATDSKNGRATGDLISSDGWTSNSQTIKDAWGNPYVYDNTTNPPTITSTAGGGDPIVRQIK